MTTVELLKPRYKVIELWPYCNLKKDAILEVHDYNLIKQNLFDIGGVVLNEDGMNKYPHLFKPLQWWEERKPEDMPEYVKDEHGEVWKVWEYGHNLTSSYITLYKNFDDPNKPFGGHNLNELTPATEAEYLSYHKIRAK